MVASAQYYRMGQEYHLQPFGWDGKVHDVIRLAFVNSVNAKSKHNSNSPPQDSLMKPES